MANSDAEVRQRKPQASSGKEDGSKQGKSRSSKSKIDDEDVYSPWVDIARVLTFFFVASCALSYLISGGESWFWGMQNPPNYLQKSWWENYFRGPIQMTPEELAAFDGTDESKPIYLSINGTIYDVSANRRVYGPGGSYNIFAGVDASRGFVTGCFKEDRNGDMRGVEEMFLPLDDYEVDKHYTADQLRQMRTEELAAAKEKVHDALKHWVDFFAKSKKYHKVGTLKREPGWQGKRKKLCEQAAQGRTPRKLPGAE